MIELSIVVPFFNEEELVLESITTIVAFAREVDVPFEIIAVNDGSIDATMSRLISIKENIPELRILSFKRNCGHMAALGAGMSHSRGRFVATIDGDLQDPPQYLLEMYSMIVSGQEYPMPIDVVQTIRTDRSVDTLFKRLTARIFYRVLNSITAVNVPVNAADYRIMTRECVQALIGLKEKNKVFRVLIPYLGFNVEYLNIHRDVRVAGKTKYPLHKMISLAIDSLLGFTFKPLRYLFYVGATLSLLLFGMTLITFLQWQGGNTVRGWTSLILLISSINAFLLAALGLVGEYLGRTYELALARPAEFAREILPKTVKGLESVDAPISSLDKPL